MKKKIIFIIAFLPVYYILTVVLLQFYWFNYNAIVDTGLWARFCHILSFILAVPILVPFIASDLGEYWPLWAQILPFVVNGLIWAVAILGIYSLLKRLCAKKEMAKRPHGIQTNAATGTV